MESEVVRRWRGRKRECGQKRIMPEMQVLIAGSTALRGMEAYTIVSACERNGRYINTNSAIISIWYWEECMVRNSVGIVQQKSPECTN